MLEFIRHGDDFVFDEIMHGGEDLLLHIGKSLGLR
jgi:hypothetical protein